MTKIITITSGHSNTGKIDSGAVTTVGGKLIKEADLAVKLRNAILHYLQQDKGITTRCDGYGTVNLELKEAIKLIKGSDAAVEITVLSALRYLKIKLLLRSYLLLYLRLQEVVYVVQRASSHKKILQEVS